MILSRSMGQRPLFDHKGLVHIRRPEPLLDRPAREEDGVIDDRGEQSMARRGHGG